MSASQTSPENSYINEINGHLCNHQMYVHLVESKEQKAPFPIADIIDKNVSERTLRVLESKNDWQRVKLASLDLNDIDKVNCDAVAIALESAIGFEAKELNYNYAWIIHQKLEPTSPGNFHNEISLMKISS